MHFLKMTTGSLLIIMGIGWGGKKYLFLYTVQHTLPKVPILSKKSRIIKSSVLGMKNHILGWLTL